MKKTLCILLILILVLSQTACGKNDKQIVAPVNFYFPLANTAYGTQSGVIGVEQFDSKDHETDYSYLLRRYFEGPQSETLNTFLPKGTELISFYDFDGKVQIILSSQISQLSEADLTVACACITRTVMELTDADSVQISANDNSLGDIEANRFTLVDFVYFQAD